MRLRKLVACVLSVLMLLSNGINMVYAEPLSKSQDTTGTSMSKNTNYNLVWDKPSDTNPFGGASNFNATVLGNITKLSDSEGPVASNGSIFPYNVSPNGIKSESSIACVPIGTRFGSHTVPWIEPDAIDNGIAPQFKLGLLLAGFGTASCPVKFGDVVVGMHAQYTSSWKPFIRTEKADAYLKAAQADLIEMNRYISSLSANGTIENKSDKITFIGTKEINIFNVDYSVLDFARKSVEFKIPKDSTVILNVQGNGTVTLCTGENNGSTPLVNRKKATAEFAGRVLYNVNSNITKVVSRAGTNYLFGSVLAPHSDLKATDGGSSINGTLVCKNVEGVEGFEFHHFPFRGKVPPKDEPALTNFKFTKKANPTKVVSCPELFHSFTTECPGLNGATFELTNNETKKKFTATSFGTEQRSHDYFWDILGLFQECTSTTVELGEVAFSNIPIGEYTLTEKSAPSGYIKSNAKITVRVLKSADGIVLVKFFNANGVEISNADVEEYFTNSKYSAEIVMHKLGYNGTKKQFEQSELKDDKKDKKVVWLNGATYQLKDKDLGIIYTATTKTQEWDENGPDQGTAIFKNIPLGNYELTEITAPNGYMKSNVVIDVTVSEHSGRAEVTYEYNNKSLSNIHNVQYNEVEKLLVNLETAVAKFHFFKVGNVDNNGNHDLKLVNARFQVVERGTDRVVAEALSDHQGKVDFENIPYGLYTLVEAEAPTGYLKGNPIDFEIVNKNTINFENWKGIEYYNYFKEDVFGSFNFNKKDDKGAFVNGAEFGLFAKLSDTTPINGAWAKATSANGIVSFANIPEGTYFLKEIAAPNSHITSSNYATIQVQRDGNTNRAKVTTTPDSRSLEQTFVNMVKKEVYGSLEFTKTDNTGANVKDAIFHLVNNKTNATLSATSNNLGEVIFSNIPEGTYTLSEFQVPSTHLKTSATATIKVERIVNTNTAQTIIISEGNKSLQELFKNEKKVNVFGKVEFNKKDNTGAYVSGAVFHLTNQQTHVKVAEANSGADGKVTFDAIPEGTYEIAEFVAPNTHFISTETATVKVERDGNTNNAKVTITTNGNQSLDDTFVNVKKVGFSFTKKGNDNSKLENAVFRLIGNNYNQTAASNSEGVVSFDGLRPGVTYSLTEESAPANYFKVDGSVSVVVANDGSIRYSNDLETYFVNTKQVSVFGSVSFNKVDNSVNPVPVSGATFGLYKLDNGSNELLKTTTTQADGKVSFDNIPEGRYTLNEISAPSTHFKTRASATVLVTRDGMTNQSLVKIITSDDNSPVETFKNLKKLDVTGKLSFVKQETGTNKPLKGAVFELKQGNNIFNATSNNSGVVSFSNIPEGVYTLSEKTPPQNVNGDDTHFKSEATVNVKVERIPESNNSKVLINDVEVNQEEPVATVATVTTTFVNTLITKVTGEFNFTKIDDNNQAVNGAVFQLKQNGKVIMTALSENGTVSFASIPEGTYELTEQSAPETHFASQNKAIVVVKRVSGKNEATTTISVDRKNYLAADANNALKANFVNTQVKDVFGAFQFSKKDNDRNYVKGATFQLTADGKTPIEVITGENGLVSFTNIPVGTYTLSEKAAPDTHFKTNKTATVVVERVAGKNEVTTTITVENQNYNPTTALTPLENLFNNTKIVPVFGKFNFDKNDNTGDKVAKAEFGLFKKAEETTPINGAWAKAISSAGFLGIEKGKVSFENVPEGTYFLKEIAAPDSHFPTKVMAVVRVERDGQTNDSKVVVDNVIVNQTSEVKALTSKFVNEKKVDVFGKFNFNKKDDKGNLVNGAVFGLYANESETTPINETWAKAISTNGIVSFASIPEGTYTLKEVSAPNTHFKSEATVNVKVERDGDTNLAKVIVENVAVNQTSEVEALTSRFVNEKKVDVFGSFSFNKKDNKDDIVNGAVFGLYANESETNPINETWAKAISTNGIVSFASIPEGTYTLKEVSAPNTHFKSEATVNVKVERNGNSNNAKVTTTTNNISLNDTFVNLKKVEFSFTKKSNDDSKLENAVFRLIGNNYNQTTISNSEGIVSFSGLRPGATYSLTEESPPAGYIKSEISVGIQVDSDGIVSWTNSDKTLEEQFVNKEIVGNITFTKYINDKKYTLAGAEFELLKDNKSYGTTVFSDANGVVTFVKVKPGSYQIKEVSSHNEYFKKSEEVVNVVVDENGLSSLLGENRVTAETKFINTSLSFIQFTKYTSNNTRIAGAVFELLRGTEVVMTDTSDQNGIVRFENIAPGEYTIREQSAPSGYIRSNAIMKVTIYPDGKTSASEDTIAEWEKAFINKLYIPPVQPPVNPSIPPEEILDEETPLSGLDVKPTEQPQTSDNTNILWPILVAVGSLLVLFRKKKLNNK
ncbi:SpaA isopeptide-forming pilin-related protein [Paludicola sp. MB14-C6]|uniref:SpaA isopeptide-forming pilin-related protein n=1 Tax=Paludihabitans sp. MB14-C6 TaxID=3070656 RepID=UPI0027DD9DA3|nr:SpaA isopeptide-forming pilin-related protein [Paludicola sp. MB14-C6]WMJ22327.1 SpaA isopeptide-forming pilin-related protein [Paludicola sp. MB14-C6]